MNSNSLTPDSRRKEEQDTSEIQCLPLYSILLALGNPTVNFFRQGKSCSQLALTTARYSKLYLTV